MTPTNSFAPWLVGRVSLLPLINDGGRIVNLSSGLTRIIMPGSAIIWFKPLSAARAPEVARSRRRFYIRKRRNGA
jgi:hypothetical protein